MKTEPVLLDSSAWIEYLTDGALKTHCENFLGKTPDVIVPTLVQYEIYRKLLSVLSEGVALKAIAATNQHRVVNLSTEAALLAADLSLEYELGMADSIILAHARLLRAVLVTLDNDFSSIPGVRVLRR